MCIRNRKILRVFHGAWTGRDGVDMPGVAGPIWYYADLFLEMEGGRIYRVVCGESGLVDQLPEDATRVCDADIQLIEGARSIIDVFEGEEPSFYVLLDDGSHLEYWYAPGGSCWGVAEFDDSCASDPEDDEDDWEEQFTSLIDGRVIGWSELIKWRSASPE